MLRVIAVWCRTSEWKFGTKPHSDKPNWHTASCLPRAEVADREPKKRVVAQGSKREEEVESGATTMLHVPSQQAFPTL